MERRTEPYRSTRIERAKADIIRRLRPSCVDMPDTEFTELAERMAELEIKYALRREKFDFRPAKESS